MKATFSSPPSVLVLAIVARIIVFWFLGPTGPDNHLTAVKFAAEHGGLSAHDGTLSWVPPAALLLASGPALESDESCESRAGVLPHFVRPNAAGSLSTHLPNRANHGHSRAILLLVIGLLSAAVPHVWLVCFQ